MGGGPNYGAGGGIVPITKKTFELLGVKPRYFEGTQSSAMEAMLNRQIVGLSKIPRIVDMFARRLQLQERLTQEVAQSLEEVLDPLGVGVICEARHFCMMMRGVEKQHSATVTSAMLGCFREEQETRIEFLSLIRNRANGV